MDEPIPEQLPPSDYTPLPDLDAIGREHTRNYYRWEELARKLAQLKRDVAAVKRIEEVGGA